MTTIPLDLDGVTDLPPGKVAAVVTFLEMTAPPAARPEAARDDLRLVRVARPDLAAYRALFRRVGEAWLWFSRTVLSDAEVAAILADPATELHLLRRGEAEIGFVEFDRSQPGAVEIVYFGVVPEEGATGAGRYMMQEALKRAWAPGVDRVWLHTCSLDHPAAMRFYGRAGFRPYKIAVEVADDPRLAGYLPRSAAPQVPLIEG